MSLFTDPAALSTLGSGFLTLLVSEVADSGQKAGHALLVAELERLGVSFGASRVDQAVHTRLNEQGGAVGKGEEGVARGDYRTLLACSEPFTGLLDRDPARGDSVHLAGAGAQE